MTTSTDTPSKIVVRSDEILVDFPESRSNGDVLTSEVAAPPSSSSSDDADEKLHALLRRNDRKIAHLADSFASLGGLGLESLSDIGWTSFSEGLGAVAGAVLRRRGGDDDESETTRAFEEHRASNLAPAASRRRSSRMSATPAQIAAAVHFLREGRGSSASSSRGSLFASLEEIEGFALRNSQAMGNGNGHGNGNGRGDGGRSQDGNDAFEELRQWMGDDAFLVDISERDEDDEDDVFWTRPRREREPDDHKSDGKCDDSQLAARQKTRENDDDDNEKNDLSGEIGRNESARAATIKQRLKRKSVISLSPMCRISATLRDMFGEEVGPRC